MPALPFAERNGWKLYAHPAFGQTWESLIQAVESLQRRQNLTQSSDDKTPQAHPGLDSVERGA